MSDLSPSVPLNPERLEQAFRLLAAYPERPAALDERFRQHILTAEDDALHRINAYRLGEAWGQPARPLLEWMLYGSRAGLFDLTWETVCPSCGGRADHNARVGALASELHCATCYHESHVHLDHQVQVTFTVSPTIRPLQPSIYANIPQSYFPVRGRESGFDTAHPFRLELAHPTDYGFMDEKLHPFALLRVNPDAPALTNIHIDYDPDAFTKRTIPIFETSAPAVEVRVQGGGLAYVAYKDEARRRENRAVSGLEVTLTPAFQQLFAHSTLSQRESISIRSLTILVTDITGSTALYQRLGDVKAYNLVRDHFEVLFQEINRHNGTVVKTIGDAVMAAFTTPEAAVGAGLAVQDAIRAFNGGRRAEEGVILVKIGVHTGSAIAVNLNDTLDYFGNMVNLAARIQSQSRSTEILLSQQVYEDAAVQALLRATPEVRVTESVFELAGIEQSQRLYSVAHLAGKGA